MSYAGQRASAHCYVSETEAERCFISTHASIITKAESKRGILSVTYWLLKLPHGKNIWNFYSHFTGLSESHRRGKYNPSVCWEREEKWNILWYLPQLFCATKSWVQSPFYVQNNKIWTTTAIYSIHFIWQKRGQMLNSLKGHGLEGAKMLLFLMEIILLVYCWKLSNSKHFFYKTIYLQRRQDKFESSYSV